MIAEYAPAATTPSTSYIHGPSGLIKRINGSSSWYFYQDASGSTSHFADSNGNLLEWYRYDLQGTPMFFDSTSQPLTSSTVGNRFLFTGQQWYSNVGVYDLRNRFYSPDTGRFLQADPIGFKGDATNLYRYVGNNPIMRTDPMGLVDVDFSPEMIQKGFQASENSLRLSPRDGHDYSQAVNIRNGKPSLETKPDGKPKLNRGEYQTVRRWERGAFREFIVGERETGLTNPGGTIGHVHRDVTGGPKPHVPDPSDADRAAARRGVDANGKTVIGTGVFLINESNPSKGFLVNPQKKPGEEPTIKVFKKDQNGEWQYIGNLQKPAQGSMFHSGVGWPETGADASNFDGSPPPDFAWGNWNPDSPYPTGPVGSAMYGNWWR